MLKIVTIPSLLVLSFLTSCAGLMPIADDIEKIATDNALKVELQDSAVENSKNEIEISVKVSPAK